MAMSVNILRFIDVIERQPRFSKLSHLGYRKLGALPKRSAIVAFSAAEVLPKDPKWPHLRKSFLLTWMVATPLR
jgi:hypothetical protein